MNWTDEEIDKLFQESASQMNVPYQDAFWTEMEALLPKKDKKKGLGWIFGGMLTSFALIAAMIFPVNRSGEQASKSEVAKQGVQTAATPVLAHIATSDKTQQTGNPTISNQGNPLSCFTAEMDQARTKSGKSFTGLYTKHPKSTSSATPSDNLSETGSLNLQDLNLLADISPLEIAPKEVTGEENKTIEEAAIETTRLNLLGLPVLSPQLAASGGLLFRPKNHAFYAQLGFGMAQSYISGTDKNWMPSINLGGGYQYRPQGFGFSAGINLSGTLTNNMEITRKTKVYNFGSTNYQQNLMYKQLYSVELPVSIDFRKNRHTISLGLAPTYLVTTVMRFSQFENNKLSVDGIYVGQKAGMNSFGLKTGIAYQLEIAKSWNIGVQLNAQMIKQVDDKQFIGNLAKLPLSGQITIRKTITR